MQDMQTLTEEIFRVRMSQYPEALQVKALADD